MNSPMSHPKAFEMGLAQIRQAIMDVTKVENVCHHMVNPDICPLCEAGDSFNAYTERVAAKTFAMAKDSLILHDIIARWHLGDTTLPSRLGAKVMSFPGGAWLLMAAQLEREVTQ